MDPHGIEQGRESVCLTHVHSQCPRLKDAVGSKSLTQNLELNSLFIFEYSFDFEIDPTVLTNADVKGVIPRNGKDVFPTLLLPMMSSLNM